MLVLEQPFIKAMLREKVKDIEVNKGIETKSDRFQNTILSWIVKSTENTRTLEINLNSFTALSGSTLCYYSRVIQTSKFRRCPLQQDSLPLDEPCALLEEIF